MRSSGKPSRTRRDSIIPSRLRGVTGPLACKGGMSRILNVEIVVLATPAAILLVGRRDLENRNPGLLHETEETCAIAAGELYSDAFQAHRRLASR